MPVDYYSKGINIRKKYVMLLYEYYKFITLKKAPRCSEQLFLRGEKKISFTSILFYAICYFFRILALRNAYTYPPFCCLSKTWLWWSKYRFLKMKWTVISSGSLCCLLYLVTAVCKGTSYQITGFCSRQPQY